MYRNILFESNNTRGEIGEILVKHIISGSFRTREKKWDYLDRVYTEKRLKDEWYKFLNKHWPTFDVVRFHYDEYKNIVKVEIFEVKTRKYYRFFKPGLEPNNFTMNSAETYKEAKKLGIDTYVVKIIFFDNWRYSIHISELDENNISVNRSCDERWAHFLNSSIKQNKPH